MDTQITLYKRLAIKNKSVHAKEVDIHLSIPPPLPPNHTPNNLDLITLLKQRKRRLNKLPFHGSELLDRKLHFIMTHYYT